MAISFSEGVRRARERATYEAGLSAEVSINRDYSHMEERLLSSTFSGDITSGFISSADLAKDTINTINVNHGWYSPNYTSTTTSTLSSVLTQQQIEQMVAMLDKQSMEDLRVEMMRKLEPSSVQLNAIQPKEPNPQMELF